MSVKDTRVLLNTVIEGTKRTIEILAKRSEQFLKLHRSTHSTHQRSLLHSSTSETIGNRTAAPKILDLKHKQHKMAKAEKYLRP